MVNVCEKIVLVPKEVEDLSGLYLDLKRASFGVRNVGSDPKGTYVYLELDEIKDPVPIVESWVGRVPPTPKDAAAWKARLEEFKAMQAQAAEPAKADGQAPAAAPAAAPQEPAPAPKRFGFIRRILGMS